MVQILFQRFKSVYTVTSFKILNDGSLYTVRSVIFNLDHEMNSFHFISNGEDPNPYSNM
jgi:hypothetical protein